MLLCETDIKQLLHTRVGFHCVVFDVVGFTLHLTVH